MRKVFFGVAVAAIALSASAFTNAEKKVNFANKTYYHIGNEFVELSAPPAGLSCQADDFTCTIQIPDTQYPGVGVNIKESDLGLYTVTPGPESGSLQAD